MRKQFLLIPLFFFCLTLSPSLAWAQGTVSGNITDADNGDALPGVNVVIKEAPSVGTITDFDGNYTIELKEGWTTLVFSYVGYEDIEEVINGRSTINIKLSEAAVGLDQVIVSASKRKEKILNAPASVSVISASKIQNQASLTVIDNLKKTPGVDIMSTGLVSANVNLRGFNGIFDGELLTMVDNRIGRVPSLKVNAFQLIPGNNFDIEKMEVVRGPGSALYGPNAAGGVLHMITKSPLDIDGKQETSVAMTTGFRNIIIDGPEGADFSKGDMRMTFKPTFRTAIKLSDKVAFKISGKYLTGHDWENYDTREPVIGQPMAFGTVQNGQVWQKDNSRGIESFDRDFRIVNYNGDARLDFRPTKDTELVFASGLSSTQNLELSGLGASQSSGWQYWYAQSRFRWKDFFVQYFVNSSDAGNSTYLIPQGTNPNDTIQAQLLIDKSKLHVVQLQHKYDPLRNLQFIYGLDALMTRPNTEGTINGRFEDQDNVNQYGGYLQGEWEINDQFKVVAAGRVDYHDVIEETQISPRAALVYKPSPQHTVRATYNKAFATPSTLSLSLDLANGIHPLWNGQQNPLNPQGVLMNIRGIGNPVGYGYATDAESGDLLYTNFWDGQQYTLANNTNNNHVYFKNIIDVVTAQLQAESPESIRDQVPGIVEIIFLNIWGADGSIQNADLAAIDFLEFLETGDHEGSLWEETGSLENVKGVESQKSETTETYELGYKGMFQSKLFLTVDAYYTIKKNRRSGLLNHSPFVTFNPADLGVALGEDSGGNLLHDNLAIAEGLVDFFTDGESSLWELFENNEEYVVDANENAYEELVKIIQDANAQLGVGVVTPTNDKVGNDMILTYINQGDVSIWGADFGFTYLVNKNIQVGGAYSFVNKNEIEVSTGGTVKLNAPKNKFSLSYDHLFENSGIGYGLNYRWYEGFPAQSAVYVGDVETYYTLDGKVFYRPKNLEGFQATIDVNNLLGREYRSFPGTPRIGRMAFLKLAYTIK